MFFDFVRERLAREIAAGELRPVTDLEAPIDAINAAYPMGFNRIAWDEIRTKKQLILPRASEAQEIEDRLSSTRTEVASWFEEYGIDARQEVVWFGDADEEGLSMSVEALIRWYPVLFSFPQHSYVVPSDASWCFNYLMEGELYLGVAPHARPT